MIVTVKEMNNTYNIYCDESCHLKNDLSKVMVLGAIWCSASKAREINLQIRNIKKRHSISKNLEIKWTKVSPAQLNFYLELVNYFFYEDDLHFRALIIPDKTKLRHEDFNQTHDDWYYKMYFDMLKIIFDPEHRYQIYLDIKDTRSAEKIEKLHDVLCNNIFDFSREIIAKVQTVRSHEVEILQLTDLLIGAIGYANRDLASSAAKMEIINLIRRRSRYSLKSQTLFRENKVNLFHWHAQEEQ
jgi:hypothetical protein